MRATFLERLVLLAVASVVVWVLRSVRIPPVLLPLTANGARDGCRDPSSHRDDDGTEAYLEFRTSVLLAEYKSLRDEVLAAINRGNQTAVVSSSLLALIALPAALLVLEVAMKGSMVALPQPFSSASAGLQITREHLYLLLVFAIPFWSVSLFAVDNENEIIRLGVYMRTELGGQLDAISEEYRRRAPSAQESAQRPSQLLGWDLWLYDRLFGTMSRSCVSGFLIAGKFAMSAVPGIALVIAFIAAKSAAELTALDEVLLGLNAVGAAGFVLGCLRSLLYANLQLRSSRQQGLGLTGDSLSTTRSLPSGQMRAETAGH